MKCEDKINIYCRQVISYTKYANYRKCRKCCHGCEEPCHYICKMVLDKNIKEANANVK